MAEQEQQANLLGFVTPFLAAAEGVCSSAFAVLLRLVVRFLGQPWATIERIKAERDSLRGSSQPCGTYHLFPWH